MKRVTSKHILPGLSLAKAPLAILTALPLFFSQAHPNAAAEPPLAERPDRATWLIEYAGDGWASDGYGWQEPIHVSDTFLFEVDDQGGITILDLPSVVTGSWGGPDEVWLRYRFEKQTSYEMSTFFSSRDMDFAGAMTSDTTAEGRFDLTNRDYYTLYGVPHYFGTFITVRRGRWSARAVAFPTAVFALSKTETSVQGQVVLDASASHDPDGSIVSYHWGFGDTMTAEGKMADHVYGEPGEYAVFLTVTDNDGLQDQATQVVKVWPGAIISFPKGAVTITWYGEAGRFYQVYCCHELSAGGWTGLGDPVPGANAPMSLSDPQAASARLRFYRVVSLP